MILIFLPPFLLQSPKGKENGPGTRCTGIWDHRTLQNSPLFAWYNWQLPYFENLLCQRKLRLVECWLTSVLFSWIRINVEVIKKHPVSRGRRDVIFNGCHLTSQVTLGRDSWMILTLIKSFEGHRQRFLMNRKSWCEKCECDTVRSERRTSYRFETRFPPRKEGRKRRRLRNFISYSRFWILWLPQDQDKQELVTQQCDTSHKFTITKCILRQKYIVTLTNFCHKAIGTISSVYCSSFARGTTFSSPLKSHSNRAGYALMGMHFSKPFICALLLIDEWNVNGLSTFKWQVSGRQNSNNVHIYIT